MTFEGVPPGGAVVYSEAVLEGLERVIGDVEADPAVRGVVISSAGREFGGGADLDHLAGCIERDEINAIVRYIERAQQVLQRVDRCAKPIVACVAGPALGGGAELALACDRILATPSAVFAFPETGLGLFPSGGGTQRTPRRIGLGLARWMIYTGMAVGGADAVRIGLADGAVRARGEPAIAEAVRWVNEAWPALRRPQPSGIFAEIAAFFASTRLADACAAPVGASRKLVLSLERMHRRSVTALRTCERLLDGALRWPLADGLREELDAVREVYLSQEARSSLSAAVLRRPPGT